MIAEIRLRQYRSYLDKNFQLTDGVNLVVGPNASGKTNLLEAVMVICGGSSFRAPDSELIFHGKNWARIDAKADGLDRTMRIKLTTKAEKQFTIGNRAYMRLGADSRLPIVLFEPNHLQLLTGSPELRRSYLDGILELTLPGYRKSKNDYLKIVRQRNALLKSNRANKKELFPWNVRLSHIGGSIAGARNELSIMLNKSINEVYTDLSGEKADLSVAYRPDVAIENYSGGLLRKLEGAFELDALRGFTTYGPHREDLQIQINGKPIAFAASRGEARTITIALKSLEAKIIEQALNSKPIILLDDVFSELDKQRRALLLKAVGSRQTIITATDSMPMRGASLIVL